MEHAAEKPVQRTSLRWVVEMARPLGVAGICLLLFLVLIWGGQRHRETVLSSWPVFDDRLWAGIPGWVMVAAVSSGGAWLAVVGTRGWRDLWQFPHRLLLGGLGLLVGLAVLAIPGAVVPLVAARGAMRLLGLIGLYVLVVQFRPPPRAILLTVSLALIIQSLVGLGQFLRQSSLGLTRWGELVLNPNTSGISVVDVGGRHWLRAYGLEPHPNVLAGILTLGVVLLVSLYLQDPGRRWPILFVLGLSLSTLLLTFSRSGWLGLLGGSLYAAALAWRQGRRFTSRLWPVVVVSGIALLWTGSGLTGLIGARLQPSASPLETESIQERLDMAHLAARMIAQHPWIGVGLDNFALAAPPLAGLDPAVFGMQVPHNGLLLVVAELGLLSGLVWLSLWLLPLITTARRTARAPGGAWEIACTAALAALFIISWFDYYPWGAIRGSTLWVMMLALWSTARQPGQRGGVG